MAKKAEKVVADTSAVAETVYTGNKAEFPVGDPANVTPGK